MRALSAAYFVIRFVLQYLFSKHGKATPLDTSKDFDNVQYIVGIFSGWNRYFRYRGGENIPRDHAAIYFANHIKFGDPFHVFRGAYLETNGDVKLHAMMRDDVFKGTPLKTRFFDFDELIEYVGVYGINRDQATLAQMKIFLKILEKGEGFIMFPGRTRSRSGLLMEYRDNFQEPGSISFFLAMIQRRKKEDTFSAMPVSRNYNPVRNQTAMIYGPEQFLDPRASKDEQRDFDFHLIEVMSGLVEISVVQIIAALLYTTALHHRSEHISIEQMRAWVDELWESDIHPWWDEEDNKNIEESISLSLDYLEKHGMVQLRGDEVHLNTEQILHALPIEADYDKVNPVKYLTNQNLHLGDFMEAMQDVVLKTKFETA